MKVHSRKPVTIAEALANIKDFEERKPLEDYFKKFAVLDLKKAHSLAEELIALNNPKMKDEYVIKVCDFLPRTPEEVHKIFSEVSLNEDETNKILEIVKKY